MSTVTWDHAAAARRQLFGISVFAIATTQHAMVQGVAQFSRLERYWNHQQRIQSLDGSNLNPTCPWIDIDVSLIDMGRACQERSFPHDRHDIITAL